MLPLHVSGILHTFATLGPAVGFLTGAFFLDIYVDTGRVDLNSLHT